MKFKSVQLACLLPALVTCACIAFGDSNVWRVLPSRPATGEVELPALAILDARDDTGLTWQFTGRINLTVNQARGQFETCLARQRWVLDKRIPFGASREGSEVLFFRNASRRLLVMLWEARIGETGFSLGEENSGKGPTVGPAQAGQAAGLGGRCPGEEKG